MSEDPVIQEVGKYFLNLEALYLGGVKRLFWQGHISVSPKGNLVVCTLDINKARFNLDQVGATRETFVHLADLFRGYKGVEVDLIADRYFSWPSMHEEIITPKPKKPKKGLLADQNNQPKLTVTMPNSPDSTSKMRGVWQQAVEDVFDRTLVREFDATRIDLVCLTESERKEMRQHVIRTIDRNAGLERNNKDIFCVSGYFKSVGPFVGS